MWTSSTARTLMCAFVACAGQAALAVDCPVEPLSVCEPSQLTDVAPDVFRARIDTDVGSITVEVTRSWAPKSVDRFYNLAKRGYYDDQRFFRVVPKYIQWGVHAIEGVNRDVYNENCTLPGACFLADPAQQSNLAGTLAFSANSKDDFCKNINPSADVCAQKGGLLVVSSQIFLNRYDNPALDPLGFAPFARVIDGMDVAGKIFGEYGEMQGGSTGTSLCKADYPCKGPDPDRIEEGNKYLDDEFPELTRLTRTAVLTATVLPACPVEPQDLCSPALLTDQAPPVFRAQFDTDVGPFVVEVVREWAPRSADRFYNLVTRGFYNEQRIFRVVPKYMQWGAHALGEINQGPYSENCTTPGACFTADPVTRSNVHATIAFAADSKDEFCASTNPAADVCSEPGGQLIVANQIFINRLDNQALDSMGFAPFGRVVSGFEDVIPQVYAGYGEMQGGALGDALCKPGQACAGPDPDRIAEGNAYLDAEFPLLTRVKQATFVAHDRITIGASPPALVTDANPPSASSSPAAAAAPAESSAQASTPQQPQPAVDTADTADADNEGEGEGEGDGGMSAGAIAGIVLGLGAVIAVGALVAMRMRRRAAARRGSGRTASDTVMMSDKSADDYAYSTSNL